MVPDPAAIAIPRPSLDGRKDIPMIRFTIRSVAVLVMSLALLSALAAPTLAAPGGNSAAAAACEDGGYLGYTDADGNNFANAGQCTRYAAKGGQMISTSTAILSFALPLEVGALPGDGCAAVVTVTGYKPGNYDVTFGPGWENETFVLAVGPDRSGSVASVDQGVGYLWYGGLVVTAFIDGKSVDTKTVAC
jgi:hypothetical protein